jgi:hypothetical protein
MMPCPTMKTNQHPTIACSHPSCEQFHLALPRTWYRVPRGPSLKTHICDLPESSFIFLLFILTSLENRNGCQLVGIAHKQGRVLTTGPGQQANHEAYQHADPVLLCKLQPKRNAASCSPSYKMMQLLPSHEKAVPRHQNMLVSFWLGEFLGRRRDNSSFTPRG